MSGHPARCTNKTAIRRRETDKPRLSQKGAPVKQFAELSTYAEKMLVHENALVKIHKDIPLDRAALVGCGVTTGMGAVLNTARIEPGSTVAVFGCGGVGLAAIQGARIAGARMIIAVDQFESKLALAKRVGATHTVDSSRGDPVQMIRELTADPDASSDGARDLLSPPNSGVDYAFEAVGLKVLAEMCFECIKPGGTATVIGMIPVGQKVAINGAKLLTERRLQGTNMGSNRFRIDMPRYVDYYLQGRLNLDDMISRRGKLEDINEAFRAMKAGEVARTVLMFE
jgi:S-(hydroxymethyl)glutathione dehydrogenase/alcohol dehydrogenase